jgi:hypothetical protein
VEETVQAKAATDASEHQRGSETKRRRKDEPKTDEDEAPPKDPMDGKEVQQQVTESPWSSRGSGNGVNGSGPNRASGSLDRSLAGKRFSLFSIVAKVSACRVVSCVSCYVVWCVVRVC